MQKFAPHFRGYEQHDTQELLSFLLDGLHEDLNRVTDKKYVEDVESDGSGDLDEVAVRAWSGYLERNRSIVVDLFQGQLKNTLQCKKCSHKCIKFESFMYLTVPIASKCDTVESCIAEFCKIETLSGENKWYCCKCKTHVDATKKFDVWKLPPVLIIILKRFDFKRRRKIDQFIQTPTVDFDLSRTVKSVQKDPPIYDLFAVSNHLGGLGGGHYTAYCKNRSSEKWFEFNDERVSEISEKSVINNKSSYVLFFNRVVEVEVDLEEETTGVQNRVGRIRRQSVSMPHLWPHTLSTQPALQQMNVK